MKKSTWLIALLATLAVMFTGSLSANLVLADGGASGSWFNPDRDGEGLFVEIVTNSDDSQGLSVAWYTYDEFGEQMWLSGYGAIDETNTNVSVSVSVTNGPVFGPDYDKEDLNSVYWGTIAIQFQTCDQGNMTYTSSIGYGAGTIPLTRLTNVTQVNCVEPPAEIPPVTPGMWTGPGVCMNVAADGLSVSSEGSTCPGGVAFRAEVQGDQLGGGPACTVTVTCPDTYAIFPTDTTVPQPAFDCADLGGAAHGAFHEGGVNGLVYDRDDSNGCVGFWIATPDDG